MNYYRPALDLRVVFRRPPDKAAWVRERFGPPTAGIVGCAVRNGDEARALADELAHNGWPVRPLLPDHDRDNRRALAWSRRAPAATLVFPRTLSFDAGAPWRGLHLFDWPAALSEWPALWSPVAVDGLVGFLHVLAARDDLEHHAAALDRSVSDDPPGRFCALRFPRGSRALFTAFNARRRFFLERLFDGLAPIAEGWHCWDRERAENRTGASTVRITESLRWLSRKGWIVIADDHETAPSAARDDWRGRQRRFLAATARWLEGSGCRWNGLLKALGESFNRNCGHCDLCQGRPPGLLP